MPGVLPSNLAITGNQLTDRSSPDTDLSIEDDAGRGKNVVVKSFLRHDLRQRVVGENALLHTLAPSPSDVLTRITMGQCSKGIGSHAVYRALMI